MGLKPPDNHVLPLAPGLHRKQHTMSEVRFWREHMTDHLMMTALIALAEKFYREWKGTP